ncbi:ferrous iron transport protein B [Acetivibrio cellulolyticus]|uniref:ferrous iron transport protein B n=1 Tax=Acetivibrio cellulolyticus TaxID=35830 RepID=UPI0001E2F083|nr:ferrous iron transport protein B [Acetivibrio cellulolyticus]
MVKTNLIDKEIVLAIAGNPNCGKTVLFNALTGARQHVGNWPGVTVEKKEGSFNFKNRSITVVDLPGTYSLGAYSEDEAVARDYILFERPDVVLNVIDSTNIERNLYLTCQLLEMDANVVLALNMYDEALSKKIHIDIKHISSILGVPIVTTVATKGEGIDEMLSQVLKSSHENSYKPICINYGKDIEEAINLLQVEIEKESEFAGINNPRWMAIKFLEGDETVKKIIEKSKVYENLSKHRNDLVKKIEAIWGDDIESIFAEKRYGYINGVIKESVKRHMSFEERQSITDRIDMIVTNRYLAIPIFLIVMWAIFQFTFTLGNPIADGIETIFSWLGSAVKLLLDNSGAPQLLNSLVVDGIISGVGSVIMFMPNILLLFFAISILEDSGYMARAAYITDRFMHTLGLHGKSFIPMIVGFGCNVPGILATRTLENKRDRLVTILINPLMSCSARLPVYIMFTGAFFTANQGLIIFALYLLGIVLAIAMGVLFKKLVFKGETSHFIMELPPYRMPTLKSTFIHMWDRGSSFIKKAGTLIVAVVVLVWVLSSLPAGVEYASRDSLLGHLGSFIAPILKPAGFGTWEASVALLFGVVAKEVVVGTLGVVYGVNDEGLTSAIAKAWTPLSALSFMVMTLIYIPCVATIGAIKRETNSWGWTAFAIGYSLVLGWVMAVIVFQVGRLLGYS